SLRVRAQDVLRVKVDQCTCSTYQKGFTAAMALWERKYQSAQALPSLCNIGTKIMFVLPTLVMVQLTKDRYMNPLTWQSYGTYQSYILLRTMNMLWRLR